VATDTANLNDLTNSIGVEVEKDVSIALLSLLTDYTYDNESGTNVQGQNTSGTTGSRGTFRVTPAVTFQWSPTITYGLTATGSRSSGVHEANVSTLSFGPFIKGKLSRDFEFDLNGGYTLIDTKPSVSPDYYLSAAIRYQVKRYWQLLLSASHDTIFTTGTGLTESNDFKLGTQFGVTRNITFSASAFYNFGNVETTGNQATINTGFNQVGPYTQFGFEAGLVWKPRKRWSTSLTYNYVNQRSSPTLGSVATFSNSYIQNTISLGISYDF
jgi:opacity protein-like surface antigen